MRLVVWNANMGAHGKLPTLVDRLRPDVLVLCECAHPSVLAGKYPGSPPWTSIEWVGRVPDAPRKPDKGLAVLTFGGYAISRRTGVEPMLEWVVITEISGPVDFTLVGVWAMNHRASNIKAFPESNPQPAAVLDAYGHALPGPIVAAGDFNHNVSFSRQSRPDRGHIKTLAAAERSGLASAYHCMSSEAQGDESLPTLYWKGAGKGTYHVDYAFIPQAWLPRLRQVTLGTKQDWIDSGLSDHVPLLVDIADDA